MPTIGAKVSQEELDAIVECANKRGMTISNLVRTILLREAREESSGNANNMDIRNSDSKQEQHSTAADGDNDGNGTQSQSLFGRLHARPRTAEEIEIMSKAQKTREECLSIMKRIQSAADRGATLRKRVNSQA